MNMAKRIFFSALRDGFVIKVKDTASGDWVVVGKTSKAEDTRDPEFPKGFVLPFDRSQEELMVRVEMMDYISSREKILIGTAEYNLMKVGDGATPPHSLCCSNLHERRRGRIEKKTDASPWWKRGRRRGFCSCPERGRCFMLYSTSLLGGG